MPVAPCIPKYIKAVRKAMNHPDPKDKHQLKLSLALHKLFRNSKRIGANLESVKTLLAFASEIEAFRGKGSQMAAIEFARTVSYVTGLVVERLPQSEISPALFSKREEVNTSTKDVINCLELLSAHAFTRTQGVPVRSHHAGYLRAIAWHSLKKTIEVLQHSEHIAHAENVTADPRASIQERYAAQEFLDDFWSRDGEE